MLRFSCENPTLISPGDAYYTLRKYQRAIQDYDKVFQLDSDFAEAYSNRASVHFMLGQKQRAIQDYDKVIQLAPDFADA